MIGLVLTFHVIICVLLVVSILLQVGRGSDMGAAFGGSSTNVFGATGATTFITKVTPGLAVCFVVTTVILAISQRGGGRESVIRRAEKRESQKQEQKQEVTPAPVQKDSEAKQPLPGK